MMQSFGEIAVYSKSIRLLTENRPSVQLQGRFLPRILFAFYQNRNKILGSSRDLCVDYVTGNDTEVLRSPVGAGDDKKRGPGMTEGGPLQMHRTSKMGMIEAVDYRLIASSNTFIASDLVFSATSIYGLIVL